MFTGLIAWTGRVRKILSRGLMKELTISAPASLCKNLQLGMSIAVDGVCLTVIRRSPRTFSVHIVPETLECTTLSEWKTGRRVNLELPLRPADRMGGHWVQGHVDGVITLKFIQNQGNTRVHRYELPGIWAPFVVHKGSVAINGVSLTVASRTDHDFSVALIPETLKRTNLGELEPGSRVNLELDVLVKTIYHLLKSYQNLLQPLKQN